MDNLQALNADKAKLKMDYLTRINSGELDMFGAVNELVEYKVELNKLKHDMFYAPITYEALRKIRRKVTNHVNALLSPYGEEVTKKYRNRLRYDVYDWLRIKYKFRNGNTQLSQADTCMGYVPKILEEIEKYKPDGSVKEFIRSCEVREYLEYMRKQRKKVAQGLAPESSLYEHKPTFYVGIDCLEQDVEGCNV